MVRAARKRHYAWTLNNYTQEEIAHLTRLNLEENGIRYVCWGEEVAPTTGTAHLQGYVYFTSKKSMRQALQILGTRISFQEETNGTPRQNRLYCGKLRPQDAQPNAVFVERGQLPQQGSRSDLEAIRKKLDEGACMKEIAVDHFAKWCQYRKAFEDYLELTKKRENIVEFKEQDFPQWTEEIAEIRGVLGEKAVVLWGDSGIGKTEFSKMLMPNALIVSHIDDLKLYKPSLYEGIIFDDMDFKHMPRTAQIHLVDSDNSRSIHVRYGTAWIPRKTKKLFTTNEFNGAVVDLDDSAIERRVETFNLRS
jgi:tRNA A37 threonylcarbamoyladenosine biosynthesis protein TsaE